MKSSVTDLPKRYPAPRGDVSHVSENQKHYLTLLTRNNHKIYQKINRKIYEKNFKIYKDLIRISFRKTVNLLRAKV